MTWKNGNQCFSLPHMTVPHQIDVICSQNPLCFNEGHNCYYLIFDISSSGNQFEFAGNNTFPVEGHFTRWKIFQIFKVQKICTVDVAGNTELSKIFWTQHKTFEQPKFFFSLLFLFSSCLQYANSSNESCTKFADTPSKQISCIIDIISHINRMWHTYSCIYW